MPPPTIAGHRAWTASSIDDCASWYHPVPDACLTALASVHSDLGGVEPPLAAGCLPEAVRRTCAAALEPVRADLERGRGFAIIERPPSEYLAVATLRLLYWIVGEGLGQPFAQNVQGTMLYDVRDAGQDLAQGARFSVTNYESSFHTDNSFGSEILDYVGLLCLQAAKAGGRSQLVSGPAVYNELAAHHPDVLAMLAQPFHVDRRGGIHAGEAPTVAVPIISWHDDDLIFRYLRYWIEAGHDKVGEPLTATQQKALNVLDETMSRADLRVEFDLAPGQMYFINNRWLLHNRTAFEDFPELRRRRHLVRLWLRRNPGC